ncbi:hypothetical protein [Gemmatimonas sp.]
MAQATHSQYAAQAAQLKQQMRAEIMAMTPNERNGYQRAKRAEREGRYVVLATTRQRRLAALELEFRSLVLNRRAALKSQKAAKRPAEAAKRPTGNPRARVRTTAQRAALLEQKIASEYAAMPAVQRSEFEHAQAAARAFGQTAAGSTVRQRRILRLQAKLTALRAGPSEQRARHMLAAAEGKVAQTPAPTRLMKALARTNPEVLPNRFKSAVPATYNSAPRARKAS